MTRDSILEEIRRTRDRYAEMFHGDVRAMMDDLRKRHAAAEQKSVIGAKKHETTTTVSPTETNDNSNF